MVQLPKCCHGIERITHDITGSTIKRATKRHLVTPLAGGIKAAVSVHNGHGLGIDRSPDHIGGSYYRSWIGLSEYSLAAF